MVLIFTCKYVVAMFPLMKGKDRKVEHESLDLLFNELKKLKEHLVDPSKLLQVRRLPNSVHSVQFMDSCMSLFIGFKGLSYPSSSTVACINFNSLALGAKQSFEFERSVWWIRTYESFWHA